MRHNPRWDITLLLPERLTRASARTTKNVAAKRQIPSLCRRGCRGEKFGQVAAMPAPGCRNTIACPRVQRRPEGPPGMAGSSAYQAPCHLVQAARCPQRIPVVGKAVFPVLITAAAKKSLNWASGFTNGAASCTLVNSMLPKAKHLIKLYPDGRSREATDRESVRSCAGPRAAGCTRTPD